MCDHETPALAPVGSLNVPVLAGSRARARQILAAVDGDLAGWTVHLRCDYVVAATASFADEIVRTILVDRCAAALSVTSSASAELVDHLRARAAAYGVADRLQLDRL